MVGVFTSLRQNVDDQLRRRHGPVHALGLERQRLVLNRLFDGFEGKLTSSKWAKLTKVSQATAARDIDELVGHGILKKDAAGGRSTSYSLIDLKT
ncbi:MULTISPECIES: hypothetical protein [unclassified Bradyrhizobium]|uniref:hypothetical protein n=1 Tax=unclassified Bradyrhizobium TaxID=2631580 RepID=UPI001CD6F685|nr:MULTISPECIES: hypothetical protein [unclassified Bradyrhizobium]